MTTYIIKDWAGNTMNWEGNPFDSWEEADDALFEHVTRLSEEEMKESGNEECILDNLIEINMDEYQIIEQGE